MSVLRSFACADGLSRHRDTIWSVIATGTATVGSRRGAGRPESGGRLDRDEAHPATTCSVRCTTHSARTCEDKLEGNQRTSEELVGS
jgi:hypothetical protein